MERKFFTEITILLVPTIFNQFEIKTEKIFPLNLERIIDGGLMLSGIESKDDFIASLKNTIEGDFSEKIIEIIQSMNSTGLQMLLLNYPMNRRQFELLEDKLESSYIKISRLIVSNVSFELLEQAKSKNFLCPVCLKVFQRESNFRNNRYFCPLDNQAFTSQQINWLLDFITQYYLENSVEVVKSFALTEKDKNRKILTLKIDSDSGIAYDIERKLIGILEDE